MKEGFRIYDTDAHIDPGADSWPAFSPAAS